MKVFSASYSASKGAEFPRACLLNATQFLTESDRVMRLFALKRYESEMCSADWTVHPERQNAGEPLLRCEVFSAVFSAAEEIWVFDLKQYESEVCTVPCYSAAEAAEC